MNSKELCMRLSSAVNIGYHDEALRIAEDYLKEFSEVKRLEHGSLSAFIKGESNYTVLLDAHIDEVGMIVTNIDENGFVTVAASGGIDVRLLAAQPVIIWGKEKIKGVFCSVPPHLKQEDKQPDSISDIKIDTGLKNAAELISVGDYVTYDVMPAELTGNKITGKSFDDRAGVAAVLTAVKMISEAGQVPVNVAILLSNEEELGCRGAKTGGFALSPDEAIAVDVSFGDYPDVPSHKTAILGSGTMIGVSPVLSNEITNRLKQIAKDQNITHTFEVMGGTTSTNADVLAVTKDGIPSGLLSIPLRNMHTPCEVISVDDVDSTAELIAAYVLSKTGKEGE